VRVADDPDIAQFLYTALAKGADAAVKVGARAADVYMLWAESLAGTKEQIARIRAAAAQHPRPQKLRFNSARANSAPIFGSLAAESSVRRSSAR